MNETQWQWVNKEALAEKPGIFDASEDAAISNSGNKSVAPYVQIRQHQPIQEDANYHWSGKNIAIVVGFICGGLILGAAIVAGVKYAIEFIFLHAATIALAMIAFLAAMLFSGKGAGGSVDSELPTIGGELNRSNPGVQVEVNVKVNVN